LASQINASNSGFGGIVSTGDSSGVLQLQTVGTTAITVDTSQNTTLAGKLTTASSGIQFSDASIQTAAASPYVLKNRIINGAMDVWQRGTTYALTNTNAYGSVDRWAVYQATTANGIANQVASGLTGFQYALKLGRNSSATTTGAIQMTQVLETVNSIPLAGQTVTFSFYAKAGANFSATSSNLGVYLATGTGTDQSSSSFTTSGWTGNSALINTTQAITTTWTRYSFTTTIASTATQVGLQLYYSPTGTAGADDNVYITGVQLEIGSTATPFERRLYGQELINCQRYYWRIIFETASHVVGGGFATSSTSSRVFTTFPVTMRTAPSALEQSGTANQYTVQTATVGGVSCSAVPTFTTATSMGTVTTMTTASSLTAGQGIFGRIDVSGGYLGWSAEL
jgi:hypothetical protein